MNGIIAYYISQFYPLIIGVLLFLLLKSLNLLKHKTKVTLEKSTSSEVTIDELSHMLSNPVYDIRDLPSESDKQHSIYLCAYFGMNVFGSYVINSAEPRKAAFAKLIADRLIMQGISIKASRSNQAESAWACTLGIMDLDHASNLTAFPERLEIFSPSKEALFNHLLKPNSLSGPLLGHLVSYNLDMVK